MHEQVFVDEYEDEESSSLTVATYLCGYAKYMCLAILKFLLLLYEYRTNLISPKKYHVLRYFCLNVLTSGE